MDTSPTTTSFMFWKDRNCNYLGCNQAFATAAGLQSPEQIIGKSDTDLPWKREETAWFQAWDRRVMDSGNEEPDIVEPQQQAGERPRYISTSKMPLRDVDGHVVGLVGIFNDITEIRELQENLRRAHEVAEASKLARTGVLVQLEREIHKHSAVQTSSLDLLFEATGNPTTEVATYLRRAQGQIRIDLPAVGRSPKVGISPGTPNTAAPAGKLLAGAVLDLLVAAEGALPNNLNEVRQQIGKATKLLRHWQDGAHGNPLLSRGGLTSWQLTRIKAYVQANITSTIKVEDLSEIVNLSSSYFFRAFRATVGESPYAYVVRCRIERAQELILVTDLPLSQIALDCGLADQAHLTRLFSRVVGVSPAIWRRQWHTAPGRR